MVKKKIESAVFEVFFREKPAKMLIELKQNEQSTKISYASVLAKGIDCTYSHAVKILQEMERAKLVSFEREGRIKTIALTDPGKKIADHVSRIKELLFE